MEKTTGFRGDLYFLSNMYPCTVVVNNIRFSSSEAAFQSFKFADKTRRIQFGMMNGYQSKKFWRLNAGLIRPDWNEIRVDVMKGVLRRKFAQNPLLADKLITTSNIFLVEYNTWGDTFYGVCNGVGKNMLGRLLKEVKYEILGKPLPPPVTCYHV